MKKILLIGLKDLTIIFRDRAALLLMLLAPFLLTLGMGLATGRFSGGATGISNIPVILVNQDKGLLGNALVDVFNGKELADLVEPSAADDPSAARRLIDQDKAAALIVIPSGFTDSIIRKPEGGIAPPTDVVKIEVYTNPTRPTSAGIIQTIVEEFLSQVERDRISNEVVATQLYIHGLPKQTSPLVRSDGADRLITIKHVNDGAAEVPFDILAYIAPGMALMFLMYTVSYGGRSLLQELSQGTLPRLLISPTSGMQVLGGKVLGVFLTGCVQLGILIGATSLLFRLKWGDPLGVVALVLAAVFAASGWGMLLTALVRTPGQVSSLGSALMLMFGILGGSFIDISNMSPFVQWLSKITPNAWGLDGFTTLAQGGTVVDIATPLVALFVMGTLLFGVAVVVFNRKRILSS